MILVGATDNIRWDWDTKDGYSGVGAKTIVYVTLKNNGEGYAVSEDAGFHATLEDPVRKLAMSKVFELFEIAWEIKNKNLNLKQAHKLFFGKIV